jgi:ParB/RepB/Spo0J family partition protein
MEGQKRMPRVSALERAYAFQRLLDSGEAMSRADIARRYRISRARVTQMLSILTLPQEVLDYIRDLPAPEQLRYSERALRGIVALRTVDAQIRAFERLRSTG